MENFVSLLGLFCFLFFAYLLSNNKKKVDFKLVGSGLLLQVILFLAVLGVPRWGIPGPLHFVFDGANTLFTSLIGFTREGSRFLFGPLLDNDSLGVIIALEILPTIIFFSSLIAVLYYLGVIQVIMNFFARMMLKFMRVSGAESLSAAANIFVGQTEAPLLIKPYVASMTRSELFSVMVGGMATVAGSVFAIYVSLLEKSIPNIAGHLLTASVVSAPAALVVAKLMIPEVSKPKTLGKLPSDLNVSEDSNFIEAAARGAGEGLKLALNVGAMLLAFIALIALADASLKLSCTILNQTFEGGLMIVRDFTNYIGFDASWVPWWGDKIPALSLSQIFGWCFAPLAWLMGIPWSEASLAGSLLGEKIVLNEFVAYMHLTKLTDQFSPRSLIILSYALCGFANFSSIAIQIGGIGGIAPKRRSELAQLGIRSVIGGTLAAFMTAALAGLLI